ncbi:ubiquitin system component Cue protein isoform X2 [Wolffia australiana]
MSALVLGKRSSCFFEELLVHPSAQTPSVSKKARLGASSWSSCPRDAEIQSSVGGRRALIGYLRSIAPDMDEQLLEEVLEASGDDLDLAIRRLNELRLGSAESHLSSASNENPKENVGPDCQSSEKAGASDLHSVSCKTEEWVEVLVREMMSASDMDDARARAAAMLQAFEKAVMTTVATSAAAGLQKEEEVLKEQVDGLRRENEILKRAVAIQHERLKEFEDKSQELSQLKQLLAQYQEQVRTLEVNNYALAMHLRQAQQSSSMPGRFHPDVF